MVFKLTRRSLAKTFLKTSTKKSFLINYFICIPFQKNSFSNRISMCENMDSNKLSQKIYSTNNFSIDNILQEKPCCSSAIINSYLSNDLINHQQELATNTSDNYKNGFLGKFLIKQENNSVFEWMDDLNNYTI